MLTVDPPVVEADNREIVIVVLVAVVPTDATQLVYTGTLVHRITVIVLSAQGLEVDCEDNVEKSMVLTYSGRRSPLFPTTELASASEIEKVGTSLLPCTVDPIIGELEKSPFVIVPETLTTGATCARLGFKSTIVNVKFMTFERPLRVPTNVPGNTVWAATVDLVLVLMMDEFGVIVSVPPTFQLEITALELTMSPPIMYTGNDEAVGV
mmetsp:Transcript_16081/g.43554  ORF Transcript_16081/g.43554 Transcript_16081/m.43554 type:complete len:209 (-) Transcript_16081:4201-4827(-)